MGASRLSVKGHALNFTAHSLVRVQTVRLKSQYFSHTLHLRVLYNSQNKPLLFPYTKLSIVHDTVKTLRPCDG